MAGPVWSWRCSAVCLVVHGGWEWETLFMVSISLASILISVSPDWSQWPVHLSLSVCLVCCHLLLWCHCPSIWLHTRWCPLQQTGRACIASCWTSRMFSRVWILQPFFRLMMKSHYSTSQGWQLESQCWNGWRTGSAHWPNLYFPQFAHCYSWSYWSV